MNTFKNRGNWLALAALALAIGCTRVWLGQAQSVTLPADRTFFVLVWLSAVALAVTALIMKASWFGRIVSLPAIAIGLFLPFTVSISEQVLPPGTIQVGDVMPSFSAPDDTGQVFDSERLRGNPVLIKFFRAHW